MRQKTLRMVLAALLLGPACSPDEPGGGELVKSDKQRITAPVVAPADFQAQISGSTDFAVNLFQQARAKGGNLFFSPHSMTLALAMLYGGARGETATQMAEALGFVLPQDRLHPVFDKLDLDLTSRGQGKQGADGKGFRLNVVNATWGQSGYSFLPAYLDLLAQNYGAGLRLLDFAKEPEPSRRTINDWVSYQTEERIKDLLPQGIINGLTRLVLTNAIYFNAAWAKPFEPGATTTQSFTLLDGSSAQVPMMHGVLEGRHFAGAGFQAAAIPYDGEELDLVVLLPDSGEFAAFEQGLTGAAVEEVLSQLAESPLQVSLPRFELTSELDLGPLLEGLGMKDAFDDSRVDLSGITGQRDLVVTAVRHKAFVKVNEAGTEAAAATAVVVGERTSVPQPPIPFVVDRPFLVLIADRPTGAVLFLGRIVDPK